MSYYTLDDAYSEFRTLEGYREYPDNDAMYTYQTRGSFITDDGSEFPFVHSHGGIEHGGRPLPRMMQDCPRPFAKIDNLSGECMDICRADKDCAWGYHCNDATRVDAQGNTYGHCQRDRCKIDTDCDKGSTCEKKEGTEGLCSLIPCDADRGHTTDLYVDDTPLVHNYRPMNQTESGFNQCLLTSHYNLQRRNTSDITGMSKFDNMY